MIDYEQVLQFSQYFSGSQSDTMPNRLVGVTGGVARHFDDLNYKTTPTSMEDYLLTKLKKDVYI